jgi:hypothetical protein
LSFARVRVLVTKLRRVADQQDRLKLGSLDVVGLRPSSRCNFVVYLGVDQRPDASGEDDRAWGHG